MPMWSTLGGTRTNMGWGMNPRNREEGIRRQDSGQIGRKEKEEETRGGGEKIERKKKKKEESEH